MDPQQPNNKGGYGKRPLWQWVLLYVVVGAIVYFLIYYYFLKPKGDSGGSIYGSITTVQTA